MKVGDLIRYRSRRDSDPTPPGSWGATGIVLSVGYDKFRERYDEPSIEYINDEGHFITARQEDVDVISEMGS